MLLECWNIGIQSFFRTEGHCPIRRLQRSVPEMVRCRDNAKKILRLRIKFGNGGPLGLQGELPEGAEERGRKRERK